MDHAATIDPQALAERRISTFERALAVAALTAIAGVWVIAGVLVPDARGHGTHEQLGLAACQMVRLFDIPCAFCGMTTAFAHLANGDVAQAIQTQPAAVVLAMLTFPAAVVAGFVAISGRVPSRIADLIASRRAVKFVAAVLIAGWIYKLFTFGFQ